MTQMPTYKGVLGSGSGTFTLDWGNNDYSLDVSVKMFKGAFDVDGTFKFDGTDSNYFIYFEASAKVSVPNNIPFIGGDELADFHFVFDYHSKDPTTGEPIGYVAAWTKLNFLVTKKDVGFLFDINDSGASNPKSIGKHAINEIKDGDYGPDTQYYTYSKSFQIPAGATVAEFQVQWPEAKGTQMAAYEFVPTGGSHNDKNIIQQSEFGKGNTATLITNSTDAPTSTLLTQLTDPQLEDAGTYYYYLYSTEQFADADTELDWQFTYSIPDPVVSLASDLPSGVDTDPSVSVDILYQVGPDLASGTTVTLYADTDNQGYDGFKVNSFTPTSDDATYNGLPWQLTNLPIGNYYLYASINDGQNPTVYSDYSAQTNFMPTGPISGSVLDNINGNVGVPGVQMYIDLNGDNAFDPSTEPTWTTNGDGYYRFDYADAADTTPLQSGSTYHVGLVTVEGVTLNDSSNDNPRPITSPDLFGTDTTFELKINSSIAGTVFQDVNQNGVLDSGEKGAQGWTVYIDANNNGQLDVTDPSAVTTSDGDYRIFNLTPNSTYTLRLDQDPDSQSDFFVTSPTSLSVTTGAGTYQLVADQNYGVLQYAQISGTIDNYNLLPDGSLSTSTSPPPSGWNVQLLDSSGAVVATTTADTTDGTYTFENVIPGNYTVHQVVPSGWLQYAPVTADDPTFNNMFASTGTAPVAMVQADFDLDGDLDIATVSTENEGGTVSFLLNNGKGAFTKSNVTVSVKFSSGEAFALEAIEGWPKASAPSLAVVSKDGWVSVIPNITQAGQVLSFDSPVNNYAHFLHASTTHGVTAGDFDEDGITDLAGSHDGTSGNPKRFDVILMKDGTRVDGQHYSTPGQLAAADMNGDGHLDLVLNSDDSNEKFNVAYGDGTGNFPTITTWNLNGGGSFKLTSSNGPVAISDVNADGLLDVILGTGGDFGLVIQTQTPESGFFFLEAVSASVVGLGADRIQGELFPNIAVLSNSSTLDLFEFVDNGTELVGPQTSLTNVETPTALNVVDVNGDGLPDLLAADSGKNGVWVYINTTGRDVDISVAASAGQDLGDLDFTNDQTAQITGAVFDDANFSGVQEGSEGGLADVRVFLDRNGNGRWDRGERYTSTNADGLFAFSRLLPGRYVVTVELPDGRILANPTDGRRDVVIGWGRHDSRSPQLRNFALAPGIELSRYSDAVDVGNDWTLRRNGAYLELFDNTDGVVLERHLLRKMSSVVLLASNFTADSLTIDLTFGGSFTLPGGIHIDGGRDGRSGGSTLHIIGGRTDRVKHVSDTEVEINGNLDGTWTDNLADAVVEGGKTIPDPTGRPWCHVYGPWFLPGIRLTNRFSDVFVGPRFPTTHLREVANHHSTIATTHRDESLHGLNQSLKGADVAPRAQDFVSQPRRTKIAGTGDTSSSSKWNLLALRSYCGPSGFPVGRIA